jgi:p-cumate 2,3-dioxygenase beta subunit
MERTRDRRTLHRRAAVNWSRADVEDFLFFEADLLDRWLLDEWLTLFDDPCQYLVPPTGLPDAVSGHDAFLVHDDRKLLGQRVASLQKRSAHAEWPHSKTRRLITNVRVSVSDEELRVFANFTVHRVRSAQVATYIGRYEHRLIEKDSRLLFRQRAAILDLDALRPEGKISIIL